MDPIQAVNNSVEPNDRLNQTKTMYQVSALEVFGRNFLAGFSRALGSITIYLIFSIITFSLFMEYVLPQVEPFISEYRQAMESITKLNKATTGPGASLELNQYQQFLKDINSSLPVNQ
jgi:hypothetical protein